MLQSLLYTIGTIVINLRPMKAGIFNSDTPLIQSHLSQKLHTTRTTITTTTRVLLHSETESKLTKFKPLKFTGYRNLDHSFLSKHPLL